MEDAAMYEVPGRRLKQLRRCETALRMLVELKDGPRDEAYYAARDAAWAEAREALGDR